MSRKKKVWWKEYLGSLAVAYGFSIVFGFLMRGTPIQTVTMIVTSGFVFGTLFFVLGFYTPKTRFRSFWLTCLARSALVWVVINAGMAFVVPLAISLDYHVLPWDPQVIHAFLRYELSAAGAIWAGIGLGLSFLINAFYQIDRKLGRGVLIHWVTGKYHTPKEEERIFMFLDLRNSTTLAEKLGNLRFSELCQDFFRDLSDPVIETQGEVSHYIGDEAVLTWKPERGLKDANCVRCFFLMAQEIADRSAEYERKFGIIPEFKAGVHIGLVVAAEVGEVKSEIVFHGDVLNTTARITGLCSEMHSDLLISGDLLKRLALPADLQHESLGMHLLKGKEHEVEIVKVWMGDPPPLVTAPELSAAKERSGARS